MVNKLLSLMIITAVVEGGSFTAFNPGQSARVDGPTPDGGYQRHQAGPSLFQHLFSGNLIDQTRAQVESAKSLLNSLSKNKKASQYIDVALENSACLQCLEDAIEAIEGAAKLVEKNGPQILNLIETVENVDNETNITTLMGSSVNILRILDDLIPNLAAEQSKVCNASPSETIQTFRTLAVLLEDILNTKDINLSYRTRQQLNLSSKLISEVTNLLGDLNKSLSYFDTLCSEDTEFNFAVINTIGNITGSFVDLFDAIGGDKRAKEIRKEDGFVKQIVESFADIDLGFSLDCESSSSLAALAQTFEDLAEVVESVGIEELSLALGVDLDLFQVEEGI